MGKSVYFTLVYLFLIYFKVYNYQLLYETRLLE